MIKMWICPFCKGNTRPISIEEVSVDLRNGILEQLRVKKYPVIVKCEKCGRVWVDEI